jgi:uncharacterized YigZ family protein
MNLPDYIKTIVTISEFKLKEKGSQFLAYSKPVQNEDEAITYLSETRKKFYDASHHCYSYKILDGTFKYSDDGEPNGTAGIRIYNAQNHFELTNLITVVVRYFGGTKLGVGPLGKAYYDAATESIAAAKLISLAKYRLLEIRFDFSLSKTVHHFIGKFNALIKDNTFDSMPGMIIMIQSQNCAKFISEVSVAANNKCVIIQKSEFEYIPIIQKS